VIRKLYLAGPLFTRAELDFNATLALCLRMRGYKVFLPQEEEQSKSAKDVFISDVGGMAASDAIVANMDGPDPDSGTCWEVGQSFGKVPIVLYRTDIRCEEPMGPYNLMLHQSANVVLDCRHRSVEAIAGMIHRALEKLNDPK
jgi:nucleoside 2-deoxyribosyltransferase